MSKLWSWVLCIIIAIFTLYSSIWFCLSNSVKNQVIAYLDSNQEEQVSYHYKNIKLQGFPFHIGLKINSSEFSTKEKNFLAKLDDIYLNCSILNNMCKITLPPKIEFEGYKELKSFILTFNQPPILNLSFQQHFVLSLLGFSNTEPIDNLTSANYIDEGYKLNLIEENKLVYKSEHNRINYKKQIDGENTHYLIDTDFKGTDLGGIFEKDAIAELKTHVTIRREKDNIFKSEINFNNKVGKMMLDIQGNLIYEKEMTLNLAVIMNNYQPFLNYMNKRGEPERTERLRKVLLEISGNKDKNDVTNLNFLVKKEPYKPLFFGNMTFSNVVYHLNYPVKEKK